MNAAQPECNSVTIANTHLLEGYSDKQGYLAGDSLRLYVHTPAPAFEVSIYRLGLTDSLVHAPTSFSGLIQDYPACAYRTGCAWNNNATIYLNPTWPSGLYNAKLTDSNGSTFDVIFVIQAAQPEPDHLLVIASTNTWQAYNNWGGVSYYSVAIEGQSSSTVHFDRPNPVATAEGNEGHLSAAERHVYRWLEAEQHPYHVISDRFLHENPGYLSGYEAVVLNTHPEYWTDEMYQTLYHYVDQQGGNLIYLGGNGIYYRVSYDGKQMEVRKNGGNHVHDNLLGGKWEDIGPHPSLLMGISYDRRGYQTYAPYEVLKPNHWIFAGTGLSQGSLIGPSGLNGGGASGFETDKMTHFSPDSTILLAKGINPDDGGASMVYVKDNSSGGQVFSVGSVSFGGSLVVDTTLTRVVNNVIDHFLVD